MRRGGTIHTNGSLSVIDVPTGSEVCDVDLVVGDDQSKGGPLPDDVGGSGSGRGTHNGREVRESGCRQIIVGGLIAIIRQ